MPENLNKQVVKATKWSTLSEVVAKLIVPITSMVLARLLTPEIFGVVTTLVMVTSFAGLFTDAGFYKYIVQHEFKDDSDCYESATVAFWSNFTVSMLIWGCIVLFSEPLAALVGNPGLGHVLIISSISIPISSFASIQSALFSRHLDFKTLFKVRFVSVVIPLVTTIPLAIWLRSYWAIVLGGLINSIVGTILLTILSDWRPSFFYSFSKLKEMLSFSIWSQVESISIWLTRYVDVFFIGTILSQYYLGLYKTSIVTVAQITGFVTAATTPVLFVSLSRLQNDETEFRRLFFRFQKLVGLLVVPIGAGIFCFSDLVTIVLLGDQWMETADFIGIWGLTSSVTIVLAHYSSEVYRAKGRPKLSVLAQWLHIIVLWPVIIIAAKYGYHTLYIARTIVRLEIILVHFIIIYYLVHLSPWQMIKNISPALFTSLVMIFFAFCLKQLDDSYAFQILSIFLCGIFYCVVIYQYPEERCIIDNYLLKRLKCYLV